MPATCPKCKTPCETEPLLDQGQGSSRLLTYGCQHCGKWFSVPPDPERGHLVITREAGESVQIGEAVVTVEGFPHAGRVSLGIRAPRSMRILRDNAVVREGNQ